MTGVSLIIRPLEAGDSLALWRIRNSEPVRLLSNDPTSIPQTSHETWFARYLANPANHCYVAQQGRAVVGYCRVDGGLISIAVDPEFHGQGIGRKLLQVTIEKVSPDVPVITAEILLNNPGSLKLFQSVGFTISSQDEKKHILHYRAT